MVAVAPAGGVGGWSIALAAGVSLVIGLTVLKLRLEYFIQKLSRPRGLKFVEKLTRDLPAMLYQFRQFPTGRTSVTYTTQAIRQIYELTPEEARRDGAKIFNLVHPDDKERIWESLVEAHDNLTPWHEEYRVVLPEAGTVWRSAHARLERMPDGGTLWHGFIIDITSEMQAAEALHVERDKAQLADRSKSEFLAMMSHDIRTPLGGILGFAELLRNSDLNSEQREQIEAICSSGETLLELVNEILDLSRIESGKLELQPTIFTIDDLVGGLLRVLEVRAKQKGIHLNYQIDEDAPKYIEADRGRLGQVLTNLVGNAIKFTDQGGVDVEVSAERVEGKNATRWTFAVRDTGIGIDASKLAKLFRPFEQVPGAGKGRDAGTGLGLSIARRICRKMGGDVTAGSTPGVGTTMTAVVVTSTVADDQAEDETNLGVVEGAQQELSLDGRRILLVEDNPVNAKLGKILLARLGAKVDHVDDGGKAILACEQNRFDLVLMDMQLLEMHGPETTRTLRELEAEGKLASSPDRLPIIALTANALPEQKEECLRAGMDDLVSKPIRRPDLIRGIASVLSDSAPAKAG